MPSYAVIGGSRGIGLEIVRQLSSDSENTVFVTVRSRSASTYLADLVAKAKYRNIHVLEADVIDHLALKAAAEEMAKATGGSLDVLINNAARMEPTNLYNGFFDYEDGDALDTEFLESMSAFAFKVNVLGFVHSVNAFLPLLRKGSTKKIVLIGTEGGEREFVRVAHLHGMSAYGTTKAAAHMVVAKYAVLLERDGFIVASVAPGLVDVSATATGGSGQIWKEALETQEAKIRKEIPDFMFHAISPEDSVTTVLRTIAALDLSHCGKFIGHREQKAAQN
ncbi:predicted protein [Postia placenta Mad-698-R]|uniref:Ketoreductase (KR) domain-containing protein n=1 Tax=Postia placenta MAD-698-R-SB12 TaxID=670580 RepID=A0A1X6MKU6_9APHY|nr:hypothetical protein POSPLADRAFT_1157867 [Postia placenta MAD-698-R-SB12]EED84594.1 predicted protein [Postia placenta Mad-698-R]OSX57024.1 hypothetical protein POSPLADRAFT_1157867 [Postia placenta MAD-698-R-SB12]